jgi:CIC family chloride channel protein
VLTTQVTTVSAAERFQDLTDKFLKAPEGQEHLFVTNAEGTCLGVISLHDIKRFIRDVENLDTVIAADILNPSFPYVFAGDPVSSAIELLGEHSFERLPVLDSPENRKLLGTVSKRKLLVAYREANLARQKGEEHRNGAA